MVAVQRVGKYTVKVLTRQVVGKFNKESAFVNNQLRYCFSDNRKCLIKESDFRLVVGKCLIRSWTAVT
jgi:hypothetical protein